MSGSDSSRQRGRWVREQPTRDAQAGVQAALLPPGAGASAPRKGGRRRRDPRARPALPQGPQSAPGVARARPGRWGRPRPNPRVAPERDGPRLPARRPPRPQGGALRSGPGPTRFGGHERSSGALGRSSQSPGPRRPSGPDPARGSGAATARSRPGPALTRAALVRCHCAPARRDPAAGSGRGANKGGSPYPGAPRLHRRRRSPPQPTASAPPRPLTGGFGRAAQAPSRTK